MCRYNCVLKVGWAAAYACLTVRGPGTRVDADSRDKTGLEMPERSPVDDCPAGYAGVVRAHRRMTSPRAHDQAFSAGGTGSLTLAEAA